MFYAQTFMNERNGYFDTMEEAVEWCEKVVEEDDYDIDLMEIYSVIFMEHGLEIQMI